MKYAFRRGSIVSDLSRAQIRWPNWGQLALDIHVAARTKVPVLISAPSDCAVNVARAIAAFAGAWKASDVVVCDCKGGDDLGAAVARAQFLSGREPGELILLLQEVHALDADDQAAVAGLVAAWHARQSGPRIISTCSVSLFDRVRMGAFDEQLFYSLNALHIVIRATS
jgi:sigma-54-interacting transcriptional regulator